MQIVVRTSWCVSTLIALASNASALTSVSATKVGTAPLDPNYSIASPLGGSPQQVTTFRGGPSNVDPGSHWRWAAMTVNLMDADANGVSIYPVRFQLLPPTPPFGPFDDFTTFVTDNANYPNTLSPEPDSLPYPQNISIGPTHLSVFWVSTSESGGVSGPDGFTFFNVALTQPMGAPALDLARGTDSLAVATIAGGAYFSQSGGAGGTYVPFSFTIYSAIPEPASIVLAALGVAILRRRR